MSKTLYAVLLVIKDVVVGVLQILGLVIGLFSIIGTGCYLLMYMLPTILIEGRLVTISEFDGLSTEAVLYETYFFYASLACWIVTGLFFFGRAVQRKKLQLTHN